MCVTAPFPSPVAFAGLDYRYLSELMLKRPDDHDAVSVVCVCVCVCFSCVFVYLQRECRERYDGGGGEAVFMASNRPRLCFKMIQMHCMLGDTDRGRLWLPKSCQNIQASANIRNGHMVCLIYSVYLHPWLIITVVFHIFVLFY